MMKFCPNLNLPESKALIEKLGLLGFYKDYIKNGYSEDIEDNTSSVANLLFINKDKFTAYQQSETIKSIVYQIQSLRKEGMNNVKDIVNRIKGDFAETQAFFKSEYADDEGAQRIASNLGDVLTHFDDFMIKANQELAKTGLNVNGVSIVTEDDTIQKDNVEQESVYDTTNGVYQKLNYDDDSSFSQSSKDTASGDIKTALSLIPKYVYENGKLKLDEDGDAETELNHLSLPKFEDLDTVWKDLLYNLIDVPIGQKLNFLKESTNPRHQVVYNEIVSNPKTNIQNEFEVVFSKQQANFVTVNISKADKSGNKSISVFDTNRSNANSFIVDNWYESFLNSGIVRTANGEQYVDSSLGKKANEAFTNNLELLKTNPDVAIKNIVGILNKLGIGVTERAFKESVRDEAGKVITGSQVITSKLPYFFSRLSGDVVEQEAEDTLEYNNPFINDTSSITLLAKLENKANPTLFEDSWVSGDNKTKYSFVNNTYLSLKMRKLKSDTNYLNALKATPYASHSYWLNQLISNPVFKDNFTMHYVDTLGNDKTNQVNKPFKRMSTKEKEFIRIAMFQNQGRSASERKGEYIPISYFIGLIPSDKTTIPIFKTLKVDVRSDENYRFNQDTIDVMYDQFVSEYNRVKQTLAQNEDDSIQKIQGYHGANGAGNKFVVFRFLNKSLIENNQLIELDDNRVREIVRPQIEEFLKDLAKQQVEYWKSLELYNEDLLDKSYKSKKGLKGELGLQQLAADYAVNQFIFMMNQTQLISGDPALHGKASIDKTWINFYKRMAKDIAPGLDGNFKNSSFNTLFLQDLEYDSSLLNEYNEKVGSIAQAYTNMNPADAQEYTTLQEHLDVMDAYGRLTDEARAAGERLLKGGVDPSDIRIVLQPVKPVYVTDKIEDNIDKMYYIKTSSFPLIPALTSGLEIDKLRTAMEAKDIQRAVYESGVKLGLQGDISQISKDGYVKFRDLDIKNNQIINLDRSGFRIQQELPYHGGDTHISEGSQARKLILNNVEDNDTIKYNGKDITGKEAKQVFEDLHIEQMNRAFDNFKKDIGFDETLGKITNLDKVADILKEEATGRSYPINDVYSIQVVKENGIKRFKIPLGFTNNSSRFESILNALVTNRVIKQELPGFSKVQGSAAGFSKIAGFDEVNAVTKSSIVWIDSKDTILGYTKESDGTLTGADILVPSWFKGEDMRTYIKEDGTLDTERLPEDLLTLIGVRIPTQGYNSMMKFKVKGFLPNYVGDLAIVPSEIVVQMGSDFDVDKLFLYRYNYQKIGNNLSKLESDTSDISKLSGEQIENAIVQMFEDRLSDPKLLEQMLEPNGFGALPEVANKVASLRIGNKAMHTFTTKDQNEIHKLNNDGKAGTGIFSLFSTFNKTSQDAKLNLKTPLSFKNTNGVLVEVGNLSNIKGIENQLKSNVIAYLQSAAVDNSKEQILGKLNINDQTMGVAGTLALMGLDESFIGYFLSQPVLIDYVNRIQQANDIITAEYDPTLESTIRDDIYKELLGDSYNLGLVNQIGDKIKYGSGELLQFLQQGNDNGLTQLSAEDLETIGKANNLFAVKILSDFLNIKEVADNIRVIQSATNIDTGGLGASFTSLETKAEQITNLLNQASKDSYPIAGVSDIFKDNIIAKSTQVLFDTKDIYSQILPQGSVAYSQAISKIQNSVGLLMNETNLGDIYKNIKSYILTSPEILNEDLVDLRNNLLKGKDNLAKRWEEYSKTSDGKKNLLTSRIKPRFAKKAGDLNYLTSLNTPASNNAIDIDNSIMYFYDMIENGTSVEKTLANDLVKYYIITGAQFGPNSIGKYISYDILEKNGFSEKLRRIEDNMSQGFILDGFVDQYFQNNPSKAKSYQLDTYPDNMVIPENPGLSIEGKGMAGYFNSYDAKTSKFNLYKKIDKVSNGYLYSKLEIKANTKEQIKDYNFVKSEGSAVEEMPEVVVPTKSIKGVATKDTLKQTYDFDGGAESILKSIIDNSNNAYFRNMATELMSKINNLGGITVRDSQSFPSNGWYASSSNSIGINFNTIMSNYGNQAGDKFEEVFLHELLHAGTVNSINKFEKLKSTKSNQQMVKDGDFTREQILSINGINNLFTEYKKSYPDQEKLNKYIELNNKRRDFTQSISKEDMQFLKDNKSELYPLTEVKEFIAAGLTSENFTEKLKQGNLWTRLVDFISNLLGVNRSDLDALYNSTITLLDTNSSTDSISEDLQDNSVDETNRQTFVSQRNEFLRAYKKQIGSVLTQESLDNIKKYADENSKYSNLNIWGWPRGDGKLELRVSRVDPINEDIADNPIESESQRFINRVLSKFQDNLKSLKERQRQLGDKASPDLAIRIDRVQKQINDLLDRKSIVATIDAAENKIKEMKKAIGNPKLNPDDLYQFKAYINMLSTLNQQIEFEEEFDDLAKRLNNVAAEAVKLNNSLHSKEVEVVQSWIEQDLDMPFDLKQKLATGLKDVGAAESGFLDYSQSSSEVVQSVGYLIERAKFEANQKHDEFAEEFTPLLKDYLSKYKTYDMFLQKDKDGKPTGFLLNKYSQEYYDQASGNFKFTNKNTTIDYKTNGKEAYEKDKKIAFENNSEEDYLSWVRHNDPEAFIKGWQQGKKPTVSGARRYVDIKPIDKWIDPQYSKLKALGNDDSAVKFYNYIEPIIRKVSNKYGQQSNYIPEIQKSTLDYFISGNMKGGFANFNKELVDSMTVEINSGAHNQIDEFTGEIRPTIPITMFGNKIEAKDKSYDLARIVEAVQYQEYTLAAKREIEPLLNIYYNILQDSKSIVTKPSGDEILIEKAPSRILDQTNYLIQSYLYSKDKDLEGVSDKKIGDRNIVASKVTDSVINYVRLKGMALNPFSAIGNILQGLTSNIVVGAGGEYFGIGDNFKSFSTMLHSIGGRTDTKTKIGSLIRKFDAFSKTNELKFGSSRDIKDTQNTVNNLGWFELQERGEYFIQGQTLVAMLYKNKVTTPDGKEVSWFDAYDKNGKWDTKYGEDPLAKKEDLYKFTQLVKSALIDVHGNYVREIKNKRSAAIRALMVFRTWIPQAINIRFGAESTDLLSNKTTKGRYRSYAAFLQNEDGKIDLDATRENIMWMLGAKTTTMSELDKINMRKNIAELALIAVITGFIMLLKQALAKGDDDDKNYTTYVINSLMRAQNDLTFFMLPSSYQAIIKDPLPLMGVLKDTIDLTKAGFSTITGDPVYKAGPRKGKSRLYKEMLDNFPVLGQVDKNLTYMSKVYSN